MIHITPHFSLGATDGGHVLFFNDEELARFRTAGAAAAREFAKAEFRRMRNDLRALAASEIYQFPSTHRIGSLVLALYHDHNCELRAAVSTPNGVPHHVEDGDESLPSELYASAVAKVQEIVNDAMVSIMQIIATPDRSDIRWDKPLNHLHYEIDDAEHVCVVFEADHGHVVAFSSGSKILRVRDNGFVANDLLREIGLEMNSSWLGAPPPDDVACVREMRPHRRWGAKHLLSKQIPTPTQMVPAAKDLQLFDFYSLVAAHDLDEARSLIVPRSVLSAGDRMVLIDGRELDVSDLLEGTLAGVVSEAEISARTHTKGEAFVSAELQKLYTRAKGANDIRLAHRILATCDMPTKSKELRELYRRAKGANDIELAFQILTSI